MTIERPDWSLPAVSQAPTTDIATVAEVDVFERNSSVIPSAGEGLNSTLLAEWTAAGGVEFHLGQAQKVANNAMKFMGDESQNFQDSFDALPEPIQSAVFSEIALGSPGSTSSATISELRELKDGSEWSELISEWGNRAGRNVGAIRDRLERIESRLSSAEVDALYDWYAGLNTRQAQGVLRSLVS